MTVRLPATIALCLWATAIASAQETARVENTAEPAAATAAAPVTPEPEPAPAPAVTAPAAPIVRGFDATADFRIGPEDILDVLVWKNVDLNRTVPVRPDGKISVPLVNDIQAAGLTPTELRQQLTTRLAEFIPSPEVSVIVREVHSVKVSVVGAVRMPGHYEVKSAATVLDMIARAQGLTEFANRDRIVVHRQNGTATQRMPFNYSQVAKGSEENFFVQPGDIIVVP